MTLTPARPGQADLLAVGFGTTVAIWATAYVGRLPLLSFPPALLLILFVALMLAGGAVIARRTLRGVRGGASVGAIVGLLNLLIIGSLLGGREGRKLVPGDIALLAPVWIAGTLALFTILGGVGAALFGKRQTAAIEDDAVWRWRFSTAACGATLVVLIAGGVVTGFQAGLAVPDWPNSYGYNMFLFPLAKMTGGIYYEHAHRLAGSLVGLTTLVVAIYLQRREPRLGVRIFGWILFVCVCVQGLLGALRVTGHLTLSQNPADTAPNLTLAVVHGVFAQVFFASLVCLRATLSPAWRGGLAALHRAGAGRDRALGVIAVVFLLVQLVLGAILRHFQEGMIVHITAAGFVTIVLALLAIRCWALYENIAPVSKYGAIVLAILGAQLTLGVAALIAVLSEAPGAAASPTQVLLTTAHQTTGALLLAATASLLVYHCRFVRVRPDAARITESAEGRSAAAGAAATLPESATSVSR